MKRQRPKKSIISSKERKPQKDFSNSRKGRYQLCLPFYYTTSKKINSSISEKRTQNAAEFAFFSNLTSNYIKIRFFWNHIPKNQWECRNKKLKQVSICIFSIPIQIWPLSTWRFDFSETTFLRTSENVETKNWNG